MPRAISSATTPSARPNKWIVLLTVALMTFMSTLDSSIVNVALPAMQREFGVGAADIQWVSSIYLLVCCAAALVFGRLGDLFGKVRLFQAGVALFTLGSLLCGLSVSLPVLIGARVVQGLGAACATANNMGIVTEAFPVEQRGRALGIVSTFVSLGMTCGPTIGGMLVAVYPWESIFLINVPVGIVAFAVGLKTLPRDARPAERERFDLAGAVLIAPALLTLFFALTNLASGVTPAMWGLCSLRHSWWRVLRLRPSRLPWRWLARRAARFPTASGARSRASWGSRSMRWASCLWAPCPQRRRLRRSWGSWRLWLRARGSFSRRTTRLLWGPSAPGSSGLRAAWSRSCAIWACRRG